MKSRTERVYVKVNTEFDVTGYMLPRAITWEDGRIFQIEAIQDCRPAAALHGNTRIPDTSCYTVVVKGKTKYLFFELGSPRQTVCFGRWYVERTIAN